MKSYTREKILTFLYSIFFSADLNNDRLDYNVCKIGIKSEICFPLGCSTYQSTVNRENFDVIFWFIREFSNSPGFFP